MKTKGLLIISILISFFLVGIQEVKAAGYAGQIGKKDGVQVFFHRQATRYSYDGSWGSYTNHKKSYITINYYSWNDMTGGNYGTEDLTVFLKAGSEKIQILQTKGKDGQHGNWQTYAAPAKDKILNKYADLNENKHHERVAVTYEMDRELLDFIEKYCGKPFSIEYTSDHPANGDYGPWDGNLVRSPSYSDANFRSLSYEVNETGGFESYKISYDIENYESNKKLQIKEKDKIYQLFSEKGSFTSPISGYRDIEYTLSSDGYCMSSSSGLKKTLIFRRYTQPEKVTAKVDSCKKVVILHITMPPVKSDEEALEPFTVYRIKNNLIDKKFTINYSVSQQDYSYEDRDFDEDVSYSYRVKKHPWEKGDTVSSNTVKVRFFHPSPSVPITSITNDKKIEVTWTTPLSLCENTKLKLIIHNLSTGTESIKNISGGVTSYTMNSVQICTKYAFTLVYASENYGDIESKLSNPIIITDTLKIGNELEASKGYYIDKITLKWASPTPALIEDWEVMRRELPDGGYSLVNRFANNNASEINFVDQNAEPGIIYQYKVEGVSQCADTSFRTPAITSVGFRQPLGMVMGTITYGTGVAVNDVTVVAEIVDESVYVSRGKSMAFTGTQSYLEVAEKTPYIDSNHFSLQFWVQPKTKYNKTILNYGNSLRLGFDATGKLYFTVGSYTLVSDASDTLISPDGFAHISVVFDKLADKNNLKIYINGRMTDSSANNGIRIPFASGTSTILYLGATNSSSGFFKGYIDDFRVWKKALTEDDISFNYSTVLSGKEADLGLYIRGEEGVDRLSGEFGEAYDVSHISYTNSYNANHAKTRNVTFEKNNIPTSSQLGYKSKTDSLGTYTIAAIPYTGNGTTYRITPMYDVHQFKPKNQTLYIGEGNIVHNRIDFEDISSFVVSGYVYYEGTTVGVDGAMFAVDGNTCVREGKIIESGTTMPSTKKEEGYYEISVPIGFHSISVSKQGHTFVSQRSNLEKIENSRFPGNELTQYDFQTEEKINFNDITKVELIGRFVGGPVEAAKPVGFGISKNNIGQATITLALQKSGYINDKISLNSTDTSSSGKIITDKEVKGNQGNIEVTFKTDVETGEFVAYLFPETYKVLIGLDNKIKVDNDTTNTYEKEYADLIVMNVNRKTVNLYNTDTMTVKQESSNNNEYVQDTVKGEIVDSTSYHNLMDVIFRISPTMEVLDYTNNDTLFGEREYIASNPKTGEILDTLLLIKDDNNYALTHPVFIQQRSYAMNVSVFEQYINQDNSVEYRVPSVDGTVIVANSMAAINLAEIDEGDIDAVANVLATGEALELNSEGKAVYAFVTGAPNITVGNNPEDHYTKALSFRVEFTDGTPTKYWKHGSMKTYVLGAHSNGNNFVTRGPNVIDFILRDPPGSNSYAWIEEGSEIESTHEWGGRFENETGLNTELKFGMTLSTWVGVGAGTSTSVGAKNTTNIGIKSVQGGGRDNTFSTTYSFNKRVQTSSDPLYAGTYGDIFIGSSYNIIFGESRMIDIFDSTAASDIIPSTVKGTSGKTYSIGSQEGITVTPQFQTDFQFSYHYIVFELIPHLELLRNSFFTHYQENIENNPTNSAYYVSKVAIDAPELGKDTSSYYIVFPDNQRDDPNVVLTDSIHYYNKEIAAWVKLLAQNEQEKVQAAKLKNLSFDAGVIYEETHSRDTTDAYSLVYEGSVNVDANTQFGVDVAGVGAEFTITFNNKGSWFNTNSKSEKKTTTYGFHLEDGDDSDYFTIDILEPKNNSTAYRVLGGQSSCPYQEDEFAQYFEPTKQHVIHQGTAKVEDPYLSVDLEKLANIPGNQSANFTLTVGNSSLIEKAWYKLIVDESTNPDGLELKIDGQVLGNGRIFLLDPSASYKKTLTAKKTRQDINTYDSIRLVLHSQCQYNPANNREDIYDEVYISVEFMPSCSDITMNRPFKNQIINSYTGDVLNIQVSDYDVNYIRFNHIILEQKSATENTYTTIAYYYKDQATNDAATTIANSMKHLIGTNGIISHKWKTPALDGKYNIRARSICSAGAADTYESVTDVITIMKDMVSPVPFGTPQPADGILSIGDDLLLKFNEDIQSNYSYRISIQGELNGDELAHNSGLYFDGDNDKMEVVQEMNLAGKSFTVEFWTLREGAAKNATLFSHGNAENKIEIGLTSDDKLQVITNGNTVTSINSISNINKSWTHIAVVYDAGEKKITAYVNGNANMGITSQYVGEYNATGCITVGTDFEKAKYYNGRMNELRVWTKALSASVIYAQMSTKLSGTEIGLIAYWPMNEARGTFVTENIRGRNGSTNATWFVLPAGRSLEFDGVNQYAKTSVFPEIESTADFSVEFWFRAENDNTNACMFSTGRGDNQDYQATDKKFSVYFDANKDLVLHTANKKEVIASNLTDSDWHHFALSVNRRGNANVYIDSELKKAFHATDYFGMFSGVNLSLGAMVWETSATATQVDNYFKGNLDDLRIWRSALTRDGIKIASSSRLKGDEAGLRAYYPFDTTESATLIFGTLTDQLIASVTIDEKVDPNNAFELVNGADFTTMAANIKPIRMLKDIGFTRVYSHDQIYLQIDEPMKKIENCILEISVSDVKDLQGNALKNTVKWTAYIDQNYLKWNEENLSFVKDEFASLSFTVKALNKSGSEQAYTIENLPSWLKASPSSGVISPTGFVEIKFTVNEGLNIGIYDENIYLKNSDGLNELLALDIRIIGDEPTWAVDPTKYNYSMNIFGQLEIEGIISADEMDKIAAFNGHECVGVATLTYQPEYDNYIAYLTVYGNTENTPLSFRIWDASTGKTYPQVLPDIIIFKNATFQGTPGNPMLFQALNIVEQNIALQSGWNWISTNIENDNMPHINRALSGYVFENNNEIKSQLRGFVRYAQKTWTGNLITNGGILNEEMYMVKVNNSGVLTFTGKPVNPATKSITINNGWTWVGYTPQVNLVVNEAFAGLDLKTGDLIKSQTEFSMYDKVLGWLGNLNYLVSGKGYMLYTKRTDGTAIGDLTYPTISSLTSHIKSGKVAAKTLAEKELPLFEKNQSIIAEVTSDNDEFVIDHASVLYSYNRDECRGIAKSVWVDELNKYVFFLSVGGGLDAENVTFKVSSGNQTKSVVENIIFKSNAINGSINAPVQLTIGERVTNEINVYPNPFMTGFTVSYHATVGNTEITLVDVMGRVIEKVSLLHETAGTYSYEFKNMKELTPEAYVIVVNNANGVQSHKLIKQ